MSHYVFPAKFEGKVVSEDNEPLIGATVSILDLNLHITTNIDGTFSLGTLPKGTHKAYISYIGFLKQEVEITVKGENDVVFQVIKLKEDPSLLGEVVITTSYEGTSEAGARAAERNSAVVLNAVSAETIEASPDITVANVIQRVSGLTVERNANGDGQYAIVRGMNKRYNYTLVNGIKIPSPDNENRYIPLDIFPAELLDQLAVSKSLTPSMEGDAIGGVVDLRMKEAPKKKILTASMSSGFNTLFIDRPYDYFNTSAVDFQSPMQRSPSDARVATLEYYSTENLNFEQRNLNPNPFAAGTLRPNSLGSFTYGDRFKDGKLGVIVAASYQNTFRGANRIEFGISDNEFGSPNPRVSRFQDRRYSVEQERAGIHSMMDYQINKRNKIRWYNAMVHLENNETRVIWEDGLRDANLERTLENNWRAQVNRQRIYNSTLQGEHVMSDELTIDWSLVYSLATQDMPDNSQIITVSNYDTPGRELRWLVHENIVRIWEKNSDQDYASYYNFTWTPTTYKKLDLKLKAGGLVRIKRRENFFDLYSFRPNPGSQEYIPYETNYEDLSWRITNGGGTPSHVLNYQSYEDIIANYGEFQFRKNKTQFIGGVRAEHTNQGYITKNDNIPGGEQKYWSILPSLHIKHMPTGKTNIRSSYFRSISRPSFLEIIPYRRPGTEEIRPEGGNPNLRPVDAHNFDARFEYFPTSTDQILIGGFYKIINNPIEQAILAPTDPQFPQFLPPSTTIIPVNLETAINQGIEVDYMKRFTQGYFKNFGIRANYTFTDSRIESIKRTRTEITEDNYDQLTPLQRETLGIGDTTLLNVMQSRPLQGQSRHIGNLSLFYRNKKKGFNAQVSMVYTGSRIAVVSAGLDTDWWMREMIQLDLSIEKTFAKNFVAFVKIANLLDTPYELYIKRPHMPQVGINELQPNSATETLVRRDFYHRNILFGVRYNFNQ
ncbi:MAG: outer membrane beta-barrel protein [Cryomorphaceae bacterium]|nr:outer membrane beta-barrel protein [Cryomorphaceae bacterium]